VAIGHQLMASVENASGPAATNAFYSDAAGKSFIKGDINQIVPFEREGKQYYRADVFQGADGKQFVGLIYRYNDSGRKEMERYLSKRVLDPDGTMRDQIEQRGMEFKRLTDAKWVLRDDSTLERFRKAMRDSSGKPATLVEP
jgi:hypothetical protein